MQILLTLSFAKEVREREEELPQGIWRMCPLDSPHHQPRGQMPHDTRRALRTISAGAATHQGLRTCQAVTCVLDTNGGPESMAACGGLRAPRIPPWPERRERGFVPVPPRHVWARAFPPGGYCGR